MKKPSSNGEPKIEEKSVKHVFTLEERDAIGGDLARSIGRVRLIESELDQVKASYKAKIVEAQASVGTLEALRINGFEMRKKRCEVHFAAKERKKYYFLEGAPEGADSVLIEDMTNDDFQADLIRAESKFECREEIQLFPPAESSQGLLVVGRLAGRWFSALRVKVGRQQIDERLDSEQRSVIKRFDAVVEAAKRAQQWLQTTLGKESASGFKDSIFKAVEAQESRAE